jgi:hypothetical protein
VPPSPRRAHRGNLRYANLLGGLAETEARVHQIAEDPGPPPAGALAPELRPGAGLAALPVVVAPPDNADPIDIVLGQLLRYAVFAYSCPLSDGRAPGTAICDWCVGAGAGALRPGRGVQAGAPLPGRVACSRANLAIRYPPPGRDAAEMDGLAGSPRWPSRTGSPPPACPRYSGEFSRDAICRLHTGPSRPPARSQRPGLFDLARSRGGSFVPSGALVIWAR